MNKQDYFISLPNLRKHKNVQKDDFVLSNT